MSTHEFANTTKTNRPHSLSPLPMFLLLVTCVCLSSCGLPQTDKHDAQEVLATVERYQRFTRDARLTIVTTRFPENLTANSNLDQADHQIGTLTAAVLRLRAALAKNSFWDGFDVADTIGACVPELSEIWSTLKPVDTQLSEWKKLRSDPAAYLSNHKAALASQTPDFDPLRAVVRQATTDWPEKETFLAHKIEALNQEIADQHMRTARVANALDAASQGDLAAQQTVFVALRSADSAKQIQADALQLRLLTGQLYIGRDRILEDLDPDNEDGPRAKFRTLTLFVEDAGTHRYDRDFSDEWFSVPDEDTWNTYKDRIGISFERKPPGKFDSETERLPQPAEMAYIASPDREKNEFGTWSANGGGDREWHWFEQYMLLSLLLNDHSIVTSHDYEDYHRVASTGATWYGKNALTGQPKFGTYGTNFAPGPKSTGYRDSRFSAASSAGTFRASPYASAGGTFRTSRYASSAAASSPGTSFGKSGMSFGGSASGRTFGGATSGLSFGSARSSSSSIGGASRSISSSGRSFGGGRR